MKRPVVGVIGNAHRIENRFNVQGVGERSLRAVAEVADALPLMFASAADITDLGGLLDVVDGVMLTGARANVHPTPLPHRAASPSMSPTTKAATPWPWRWSRRASRAACRCSASAAACRR